MMRSNKSILRKGNNKTLIKGGGKSPMGIKMEGL
jgi:hypothetical protein